MNGKPVAQGGQEEPPRNLSGTRAVWTYGLKGLGIDCLWFVTHLKPDYAILLLMSNLIFILFFGLHWRVWGGSVFLMKGHSCRKSFRHR